MDAKLKALKVVDLKQILSSASVSVPAKATKNDLIAKIQSSKAALDAYAKLYPPDDLLAPPEEVDWNVDQPEPAPAPAPVAPTKSTIKPHPVVAATLAPAPETAPEPAAAAETTPVATTEVTTVQDLETEKRRQRAARFGIPVVEPKAKRPARTTQPAKKSTGGTGGPPAADPEALKARAARFGIQTQEKPAPANGSKKRSTPATEEVDAEEAERRKKRAERFGIKG